MNEEVRIVIAMGRDSVKKWAKLAVKSQTLKGYYGKFKVFETNPRECDGMIAAVKLVFDTNMQSTEFRDAPVIQRLLTGFGNHARQSVEPRSIRTWREWTVSRMVEGWSMVDNDESVKFGGNKLVDQSVRVMIMLVMTLNFHFRFRISQSAVKSEKQRKVSKEDEFTVDF